MITTLPAPAENTGLTPARESAKIVPDKITHKCDVDGCGTTVFEVKHGMLIIERTHHGERHTTIVSIADLYRQYANVPLALPPMVDWHGGAGV